MYTLAFMYNFSADCFALDNQSACCPQGKHTYHAPKVPQLPIVKFFVSLVFHIHFVMTAAIIIVQFTIGQLC